MTRSIKCAFTMMALIPLLVRGQQNPPQPKYKVTYFDIERKRNNKPALASHADSIFRATENTLQFIGQLKTELQQKDSSGRNTGPARELLVNTPASKQLRQEMILVSRRCNAPAIARPLRVSNWSYHFFGNTSTIGAITLLTKFQADCKRAAAAALDKIDGRL